MQRITEVGSLFVAGDPSTNTKGTVVTAAWLNAIQEEISRAIELAGIVLSAGSNEQLSAAFSAMITARAASATVAGIVELATSAETQTGTDAARAVTPAGLAARTATQERAGIVELATFLETQTGTDVTRAITPAGLAAAVLGLNQGWQLLTGSRALGTTYTNSTGRLIFVNVVMLPITAGLSPSITITDANGTVSIVGTGQESSSNAMSVFAPVPNGATYRANSVNVNLSSWSEFR